MSANVHQEPAFTAIFCDDIREEVDGKHTLVGVYGSHLISSEFPGIVAKLGILVRANLPLDSEEGFSIRVERGKDILVESEVSGRKRETVEDWPSELDAPRHRTIDAKMVFSPIQFADMCTLRVIIIHCGNEYIAGKLHVTKMDAKTLGRIQSRSNK